MVTGIGIGNLLAQFCHVYSLQAGPYFDKRLGRGRVAKVDTLNIFMMMQFLDRCGTDNCKASFPAFPSKCVSVHFLKYCH